MLGRKNYTRKNLTTLGPPSRGYPVRIRLTAEDFDRLSVAFFDELKRRSISATVIFPRSPLHQRLTSSSVVHAL